MTFEFKKWSKPVLTLLVMGALALFAPASPIDPWNLLNPKKIATMVFALAFIQVLGAVMTRVLGAKMGSILTGFFGGLISSTATTASLARRSKIHKSESRESEMLVFLSATSAMLIEGLALMWTGLSSPHFATLGIFLGPLLVTVALLWYYSRKVTAGSIQNQELQFEVLPLLKLAAFVVLILLLSKILQKVFGQNGLMVLTFFVSLFEIHGSVIASVQLHETGLIEVQLLGSLLALSVLASYLSKWFLIASLGDQKFKKPVGKATLTLLAALFISWLAGSC